MVETVEEIVKVVQTLPQERLPRVVELIMKVQVVKVIPPRTPSGANGGDSGRDRIPESVADRHVVKVILPFFLSGWWRQWKRM